MKKMSLFIYLSILTSSVLASDYINYSSIRHKNMGELFKGQGHLAQGLMSGMGALVEGQLTGSREYSDYFPSVDLDIRGANKMLVKRNCMYAATFNALQQPNEFMSTFRFDCSSYASQMSFYIQSYNFPAFFATMNIASMSLCVNKADYLELLSKENEACLKAIY